MQIKNLASHDITFMFKDNKRSTEKMPVFDTFNLVAGWTVLVSEDIWAQICEQTVTEYGFIEETVVIEGATMKDSNGKPYTPTKSIRQWDGTSKEVNLVEQLIRNRQLEVIATESKEVPMPPRDIMEIFLKRFNEKITDKMTDEEVFAKVEMVKAELKALSF